MPDTPDPSADPRAEPDDRRAEPDGARRRRPLPVGPLGMFMITAISLSAALAAGLIVRNALVDDAAVNVQEALDSTTKAPLVINSSVRAEIGSPAPDVRLEYLDGGVQQLAEVAGVGTPVVLNFWASTCIPCLNEMPALEQVRARFEGELTVVGVGVADTKSAAEKMVERTGVRYRNARDPRSEIFAVFGGIALPRTVFIGADGVVVATHSGELDADELTGLLVEHEMVDA